MTKEFSKSAIQKQEPLRQIESMDVCTTDIRKLVSTMLFLSHSKLAIKLRYILALYKIESQQPSETLPDCVARIHEQMKTLETSIKEIEQAKLEALSNDCKQFEAIDIRTRQTLFTQDCGGQGKWNEWNFYPDEIRDVIKDIIHFILFNVIEYTAAIHDGG